MEFTLPPGWAAVLEIVRQDFPDAVIAGGSLRDLILGREVKDIDIFAYMPSEASDCIGTWSAGCPDRLTSHDIRYWAEQYLGPAKVVVNDAWAEYNEAMDGVVCAVEIDARATRPLPVQLITMNREVTLLSAVDRIDFGLCRVSHNGNELFVHPDFEHDRANECFTLRRSTSMAQYERSRQRHLRFMEKYPGWPMVASVAVDGENNFILNHPEPFDWDAAFLR